MGTGWWRLGPELWAEDAGGETSWQLGKVETDGQILPRACT